MKRFAIIENQAVVNVAIATSPLAENWIDLTGMTPEPGVGWGYVDSVFVTPPVIVEPVAQRLVSVGAFFDRFGPEKWAILSDTNTSVQAVVKDSSIRKHIDLDNPDLPTGLSIVRAAGHAIDVDKIIHSPVLDKELP